MRPWLRHFRRFFTLGMAVFIPGCSDATVDLQQQIAILKEELEKARAEKTAAAMPRQEEKPATPSAPDPETLKQNYETAGRALRAALEKELSGVLLENFTLYQPKLDPHPHRAEFSMEFKAGGTKFTLDRIPVKGSLEGTWFFPSTETVVAQIERVKAAALAQRPVTVTAPISPQNRPIPTPVPTGITQTGVRELASPASANKTVSIEWDSRVGTPAPAATTTEVQAVQPQRVTPARPQVQEDPVRPPRSQESPQPPARQGAPNAVMPAQREVQIKF